MDKQTPDDKISLKELFINTKEWFSYLLSKWLVILLFSCIGVAVGLIYASFSKLFYTASLSFALEDQQPGGGLSGALGIASQFGFDVGGGTGSIFVGANLIELFKSRTIVEQTLLTPVTIDGKTTTYAETYVDILKFKEKWSSIDMLKNVHFPPNASRQQFSRAQDSILGVLYGSIINSSLKVEQKNPKVDFITIEMQSGNERFAKYFAEALATEVSDFYIMTKSKKARINMEILEKQTDSIRRELNGAITGVAIANDNTFGLNPALNVRRAPSARRQVDVQANTAILTELVKQTELAKVTVRKETPLIQVIDRPIFPLKKEKFGKLKGIVFGGLIAGFLIVFILTLNRVFKKILK
ncbi:MAG: hypothetical protein ABIQ31_06050 [Ferruginibacter sp.]